MALKSTKLFPEHPCSDCKKYGKCKQHECDKFQQWFNQLYIKAMGFNTMFEQNRIAIDGKTKSDFDRESESKK